MEGLIASYAKSTDNTVLSVLIIFIYLFLQAQIGLIFWVMVQVKDLIAQLVNEVTKLRETIAEIKGELHGGRCND